MSKNRSMLRSLRRAFSGQQDLRASQVVLDRAAAIVRTHPGDAEAVAELRSVVSAEPGGARMLLERFADGRESARTDRIYRLVRAALDDAPVEPVDPANAVLFARLDELAQMPIGQAFRRLAEIEPALDGLTAKIDPYPVDPGPEAEHTREALMWQLAQRRRVAKLAGPQARRDDPVLRAWQMQELVLAYLRIAAGDVSCGDEGTSYHDVKRRTLERWGQGANAEVIVDERTGMTRLQSWGRFF
jgi:hypothetical protein